MGGPCFAGSGELPTAGELQSGVGHAPRLQICLPTWWDMKWWQGMGCREECVEAVAVGKSMQAWVGEDGESGRWKGGPM